MRPPRRAFLCSGQGQQLSGTGIGLLEHPRIRRRAEELSKAAGRDIPRLLSGSVSPEDVLSMHLAQVSQALLAHDLEQETGPFCMVAGRSLGELSALACLKTLSDTDAMRLAAVRGQAMAEACADGQGGMLALLGRPLAELEQIVQDFGAEGLWIANYNTPRQLVLSGFRTALESCATHLEQHGVHTVMLAAAGAFHSPLMAQAAEKVYAFASRLEWRPPCECGLSSMTGKLLSGKAFAAHCALQMISPVRWVEVMETMLRAEITEAVESGTDNTLGRFFEAFPNRGIKTRPAGTRTSVKPAHLQLQDMKQHA